MLAVRIGLPGYACPDPDAVSLPPMVVKGRLRPYDMWEKFPPVLRPAVVDTIVPVSNQTRYAAGLATLHLPMCLHRLQSAQAMLSGASAAEREDGVVFRVQASLRDAVKFNRVEHGDVIPCSTTEGADPSSAPFVRIHVDTEGE